MSVRQRHGEIGRGAAKVLFDPDMCPLLSGLSDAEKADRMENDPIISACVRKLEHNGDRDFCCRVKRAQEKQSGDKPTGAKRAVSEA